MRLIRFGPAHDEKPGILAHDGSRRDLTSVIPDINAASLASKAYQQISTVNLDQLPRVPDSERWAAPVGRPGKVVCIGLNYRDHAEESGMAIPQEPIVFFKAPNTVVGPYDPIQIPRNSAKTDWEIELGVVIGREARYLASETDAAACIAGYCISHDVSERAFQLERGGQWVKGKSCDTFNPLGPWLATPDEIIDPHALTMQLNVNGQTRQRGNTDTMICNVHTIVHYLSQFMTLEPGDLINTGTPPGVGLGMKPPTYLRDGDIVELTIDRLGTQRQLCINAEV